VLAHLVEETRAVAEHDGALTTGYQTTLPKPRRPVKGRLIWSQSECRARLSGAPMDCRRWAERAMRPEYVASSEREAPGASGASRGMEAWCNWPVWSASELTVAAWKGMFCALTRVLSQLSEEEICSGMLVRG